MRHNSTDLGHRYHVAVVSPPNFNQSPGHEAAPVSTASGPTRVLVVYHCLPHYRFDVFQALEAIPSLEVHFAAGLETRAGIATIPPNKLKTMIPLDNHWFGNFLWQRGLLSLVFRTPYDVVIFLGDPHYITTFISSILCRAKRIRILYWTIGWHRPDATRLQRYLRRLLFTPPDLLLLYGNIGRRYALASGYPENKLRVIYNSTSEAPPATNSECAPGVAEPLPHMRYPVLTVVARLIPNRGLHLLIDAAAELSSTGDPVEILIVGDGPERMSLFTHANERNVRLHMPGPLYDAASLEEIYSRSSLTVIPGWAGLTVIQSLKHGVPVITHDNFTNQGPEVEAVRPGRTGDLYQEGNLDDLVETIRRWLPRARLDSVAQECKEEVAERWTGAFQAHAIAQVIAEVHPIRS